MPFAVMDFELADPIKSAIASMIQDSDAGYLGRVPELGENFARFAQSRWDWKVDPSDLRIAPDVGVAVIEVMRLLTNAGDRVMINTPVYYNFFNWIAEIKCLAYDVPLIESTDQITSYRLDLAAIRSGYQDGVRVHILCHPHNPVGAIYPVEDLIQLAELAREFGVRILSDEIHSPLVYNRDQYKPFLSISQSAKEVGIAFVSATKAFSFAGLKCAQIIAQSEEGRILLNQLPTAIHSRASLYGAIASQVAYGECESWLDAVIKFLDQSRNSLARLINLKLPGVRYNIPAAGYFGWLDLRELVPDEKIPTIGESMITLGKIAVAPGQLYGPGGQGFIRINFATSDEILQDAVERIATALERI